MGENMNYPENPIDFIKQYSFSDKQRVYTNGSELISVFRVGQMIEHYMSDLTPQQIKDMQFCLREKSRECGELRREIQELKNKKNDGWIPVEERLPEKNEYFADISSDREFPNGCYRRLEIAYMTDTVEYTHGYYDGYKWMDKWNDIIKNVVAWKIHDPYRPERSEE